MDKKRFDELVESAEEGAVLHKLLRVARAAKNYSGWFDTPFGQVHTHDLGEVVDEMRAALKDMEHLL